MPLDGVMLNFIKNELKCAIGAKVDKVYQPSKEELVIGLRGKDCNEKLLLCARANSPRIHFTKAEIENPQVPPMFCMLLRKRLNGAKISNIRQSAFERVLLIDFFAHSELGDEITLTIAMEIMGRYSNIVFIDETGRVIDSIKRVDYEMSSQRLVLPGLFYQEVPPQDKKSLTQDGVEACCKEILSRTTLPLSKAILDSVQGISPLISREIAHFACSADIIVGDMSELSQQRLMANLEKLAKSLDGLGVPTVLYNGVKPQDFSYMPITQYGDTMRSERAESFSKLLDGYYSERDLLERMRAKSSLLTKTVTNAFDRANRKYMTQTNELKNSQKREELRLYGDLITSNMHLIKKGDSTARLINYYDESCPEIEVKLDEMLTPAQNAQKYYKAYRRAQSAQAHLEEQMKLGLAEMDYLDTVLDALSRARSERELSEIRTELEEQGYLRSNAGARRQKVKALAPHEFLSDDGFTILVGRNNRQNDELTMRQSMKEDIWLHTLKIPGSHTIIKAEGREVPNKTIEQAAVLAATHSKAKQSGQVAVDFTKIRHVSKPNGSKPGFVIYTHQTTVYVKPDEELARRLKKD